MNVDRTAIGAALCAAMLVQGCGGGGDSGGEVTPAPAAVAAAARLDEPILFVGRCHLCSSSSIAGLQAVLDDQTVLVSALGSDAIVVARGTQTTTTLSSNARTVSSGYDQVEARSAVVGTIEWIDLPKGRLGVLGQEVQAMGPWVGARLPTTPGTASSASFVISQLAVGQRVRVFGFDMEGGVIEATGVHAPLPGSGDRVTGTVSRIDLAARRLYVGELEIDGSAANLEGFPGGEVQVGDRIEAVGDASPAPRRLLARRLVYRDAPLAVPAGTLVDALGPAVLPARSRTPGLIDGASPVRLGGQLLQLAASCLRELGPDAGQASLHARATTAGTLAPGDGTRWPCRLQPYVPDRAAYLSGTLRILDARSGEWAVLDVTLQAQAATTWFEGTGVPGAAASFKDGDVVTVGLWPTASPARAIASYVVRGATPSIEPPARARLEGWMSAPATNQVAFLGRTIRIDAQTQAGLRDCSAPPGQGLNRIGPEAFTARAFTVVGIERWVAATVDLDAAGEWRAVTIETWSNPYCD